MGSGGASERRYQVFVSSTFKDLTVERQEVIQAMLELDCFPAGMELFPASNDERWDLIKSVIDDSDYYIVIVGGRYGSVDDEGISYTEREYDYAVESGKPVLGFLHADPDAIPKGKSEKDPEADEKLTAFREKVSKKMCKQWKTPEDLGSKVSRSLVNLIKKTDATGWVRGDAALTPEVVEELAQLRTEVASFELERERRRVEAPANTEQFAHGEDEVEFDFEIAISPKGRPGYETKRYGGSTVLSWDDVFGWLGPAMFDEANEVRLKKLLTTRVSDSTDFDSLPAGDLKEFSLDEQALDKVKIQLVALQLIQKSQKKHGIHDHNTYWQLTTYGETYLMRLHAAKRPTATPDA